MCKKNMYFILACILYLYILQIIFCLNNMLSSRVGAPVVILLSKTYNK